MRVLITGSRDWNDRDAVEAALGELYRAHGDLVVVHGGCPTGADEMAEYFCWSCGIAREVYPADWKTHGRKAGPLRNAYMVSLGADLCLAFIRNGSRGATGTATLAEQAGIRTLKYRQEYPETGQLLLAA